MFKDTQEYAKFSTAIRSALETEIGHYDLNQLCELTALMAKGGDDAAGDALRDRVWGHQFGEAEMVGYHALVVLDGVPAVVELSRRFGELLIADSEEMLPSLGDLTYELDILPKAEIKLRELAETDTAIRAYLDKERSEATRYQNTSKLTKEQRQEQTRERIRKEYPLEKVFGDASAGIGEYPGRYMSFGKYASEEDLREVMRRLEAETDENVLMRLLWIFRRAALPDLYPRIWALAESKNDAIRAAATEALAQSRDPRVGEFGRAKLCSPNFSENDSEVLDLFIRNYRLGDEDLIMPAISRLSPNDDNAHNFGYSILKICKENDLPVLSDLLTWVYETTPCTTCRRDAVKWMANNGCVSHETASECLHDADEDTQKIGLQAKSI